MFIIYPVLGAVAATILYAIFNEVFGNEKGTKEAVTAESKKDREPAKKDKEVAKKDKEAASNEVVAALTPAGATSRKRSVSRSRK